jgi:hypothetical protein
LLHTCELKQTGLEFVISYVNFLQTLEEALKENSENQHPYVVCTGTIDEIDSAVVICNKKVITSEIGGLVFSSIMTLLAVHYAFELAFNPITKQVLEFIQETLIADPVPNKKSTSYSNLYRSIMCIKQRFELEHINQSEDGDSSFSEDQTQTHVDF